MSHEIVKPAHYKNWEWLSRKAFDRLVNRPHYITYAMIEDVTGVKSSTLRYFANGVLKDLRASDAIRIVEYFEELDAKH